MSVPFVGPSYNLRSRTADVQRTIGMIPLPLEPANERAVWAFKDIPGLTLFAAFGAVFRGALNINGRIFVVAGPTLYELKADATFVAKGTLFSSTGNVGITANTLQVVVSDGALLYVFGLQDGTFVSAAFPGKARIDYLNQYILFVERDSEQFGWTALADATSIDALDFASAETSPDNLVSLIVDHRELILLGSATTEDWANTTSSAIFERNQGVAIEQGIAAEFSVCQLDDSVYWLAASERGQGAVIRLSGYTPVTVSTQAIEERMTGLDLTGATAYAYESEKSKFYCLNVPGLDSTLVFDAHTNQWHERCELVNGARQPHRATHHVFAFGKHMVGDASGKLYVLDPKVANNAGDTLLRERVMPINATPLRDRFKYDRFALTCDRGTGGTVAMRFSPDGGAKWSPWRTRTLGALGIFNRLTQWKRLNSARDLVVHVRCTDNVPFNPLEAGAQ